MLRLGAPSSFFAKGAVVAEQLWSGRTVSSGGRGDGVTPMGLLVAVVEVFKVYFWVAFGFGDGDEDGSLDSKWLGRDIYPIAMLRFETV